MRASARLFDAAIGKRDKVKVCKLLKHSSLAHYAERDFLPLALLLFRTLRPFFVLILFLKPCSFFLCLTFG